MTSVITIALIYGAVLGVAMLFLTLLTLLWNPEILLREYPPDIRRAHGPMSPLARRQHVVASLIFVAVFVAVLVASYYHQAMSSGGHYTFVTAWVHAMVVLGIFNLFDFAIIDWLVCVQLQPRMIVLPGTEGLEGYSDLRFHVRGFVIGMVGILVASPIVGAVAMLAQSGINRR
jgi:hypothetical protein